MKTTIGEQIMNPYIDTFNYQQVASTEFRSIILDYISKHSCVDT